MTVKFSSDIVLLFLIPAFCITENISITQAGTKIADKMDDQDYCNECQFEYGNIDKNFENDIDQHADKMNDEKLSEENASHISEVNTNERSRNN